MKKIELFQWEYLKEKEFVVIDIETTSFSPEKGGRIIELGAVKFKDGKIIDEYDTLINPQLKISSKITEITGITNEMVKYSPLINNVLPIFKNFIGECLIVAHNADFDWNRFLIPAFKKAGIFPKNKVLDTVALSKRTFPKEKKHNLADLCSRLEVKVEGHHRALNDVKMTGYAYLKMLELNKDNIPTDETQLLIFNEIEPKEIFNPEIRRVSYWEMKNSKKMLYSRQYVVIKTTTGYGNVFYDIINNTWNNKDYKGDIDFNVVEKKVLEFLSLKTINDLKSYRN